MCAQLAAAGASEEVRPRCISSPSVLLSPLSAGPHVQCDACDGAPIRWLDSRASSADAYPQCTWEEYVMFVEQCKIVGYDWAAMVRRDCEALNAWMG